MARRHEATVPPKLLIVYGAIVVVVAIIGIVAIWSFIEQQSVVIRPETLPKVTVVTTRASSQLGAAWVRLLNAAELQATLVPLETFDPIEGVVIFCDVEVIPPRLAVLLQEFVQRGGALAFVGAPPQTPIGKFKLFYEMGEGSGGIRFSEHVSPVLARLVPGYVVPAKPARVALLKETPRMVVDARWTDSERAAVMHIEREGARYLWFGFDPRQVAPPKNDITLHLMLRTAFRWVAGQPVSDGAIGDPQSAKTFTPGSRRKARADGFGFSVDRMRKDDFFSIRMINRGGIPLTNPTVKLWVPPDVTKVAFSGSFIMHRDASLTGIPEDGTVLVSLPRLRRNEDRVMKLKVIERRPRPKGVQDAATRTR
jgi:hypothetical protein